MHTAVVQETDYGAVDDLTSAASLHRTARALASPARTDTSNIFICYRRADSQIRAEKLFDDIGEQFGDHQVFMDLERVRLGDNFVKRIVQQIGTCAALLVVIGPDWLKVTDEKGRRRIDDERDHVRIEIEMALARDSVIVIPMYVNGARPLKAEELPLSLAGLSELNGRTLRDADWDDDVAKVVARLTEEVDVVGPDRGSRRGALLLIVGIAALALVAVFVVAVLPGSSGGPTRPPRIPIGALYTLKGTNANAGRASVRGVELAIDYVNDGRYPDLGLPMRPGAGLPALGGAKLELHVEDVGRNRCDAPILFDRLVTSRNVAAVIGAYESTVTLQAIYAANRLEVPLVNDTATAAQLTAPDDDDDELVKSACGGLGQDPTPSPWFTRIAASETQFAHLFGDFLEQRRTKGTSIATAAILYEAGDIFGESALSVTKRLAQRLGIKLNGYPYASQLNVDTRAPGTCAVQTLLTRWRGRSGRSPGAGRTSSSPRATSSTRSPQCRPWRRSATGPTPCSAMARATRIRDSSPW